MLKYVRTVVLIKIKVLYNSIQLRNISDPEVQIRSLADVPGRKWLLSSRNLQSLMLFVRQPTEP